MCKKMLELQVTCFSCGMMSSPLWAKRARRFPTSEEEDEDDAPYFSLLQERDCPAGAVVLEDGSVHLCAYCFALFNSMQIRRGGGEEGDGQGGGSRRSSTPNLEKQLRFICGVCGVQTYRKRVRALPIQKFQFLSQTRKPGSLSINYGKEESVVVCLDCSETLWNQSDEYDRWGMPHNKRHFNWMARPPPPEDSDESDLARLPSGKSQLPRTPPTEPALPVQSWENSPSAASSRPISKRGRRPRLDRSNSSSNSNSSTSSVGDGQQGPPEPKKRMSEDTVFMMEQAIPHLESLGLSTSPFRNHLSSNPTQPPPPPLFSLPLYGGLVERHNLFFPRTANFPFVNPGINNPPLYNQMSQLANMQRESPPGFGVDRLSSQFRARKVPILGDFSPHVSYEMFREHHQREMARVELSQAPPPEASKLFDHRHSLREANLLKRNSPSPEYQISASRRFSAPVVASEIPLHPKKRKSRDHMRALTPPRFHERHGPAREVSVLRFAPAETPNSQGLFSMSDFVKK